jgi:Tfp pilus assembly protein PilO
MLANRTSRWSIGTALLCILLLAASWFLLISPRRADAADVRGQATTADGQAALLQTQIALLKTQFADLPKQKAELKAITAELPPGADVPALVRTLQSIAAQTGVSLDSISPGGPTVVTATGAAATSVAGAGSLVRLPMDLVVTGEYFETSLFIKNLQSKITRSYLVTGIAVAPAQEAAATATPSATATPTAQTTATATPASTPTPTAAAPVDLTTITLTMQGSVFVLLDGTVTLDDVARQAKAAAIGKQPPALTGTTTPTTAPTGVPAAGGAAGGTS